MSIFDFTSQGIGVHGSDTYYTVDKYADRYRKQWSLNIHQPSYTEVVAYFRSEEMAREFCALFRLSITDHREARP